MRSLIIFFSLLFITASCSNRSSESNHGIESARKFDSNPEATLEAKGNSSYKSKASLESDLEYTNRKLIWTANLEFRVKDVDQSTKKISALCESFDASISDMELTSQSYRVENEIVIRVPNQKFHKLVAALKGQAIYMDKATINSDDVTEEFVDIESRLETKRKVRDRYIEILRTKTGSIKDIFEAEENIRVITEEIEAKEGRLRYLKNQVNFSTISMKIYHTIKNNSTAEAEEEAYGDQLGDSFNSGWIEVKYFFLGLISIWPFLLVVTSIGIWKRKWIRGLIQSIRK